ncbi:MAG: hypothetical protein ACT4O5_03815 [Gammaproteobacteria bacterium]
MNRAGPLLIWVLAGFTACACALLAMPASHVDGTFIPVGNDSFYHARRILDAIPDLTNLAQFDPFIHAPEGSLIVWPWGFDLALAAVGRTALAMNVVEDPMSILVFIPPLAAFVSVGLVVGICRELGLSTLGTAIGAFCVALSPLTQLLHGVGMLDHHVAEYVMWLASIWLLLRWLREPYSLHRGVLAGCVLGFSAAFHSDLFILQLPLVAGLGLAWFRGTLPDRRSTRAFAAALVVATVAAAVPSLAFRQNHFEFFTLSWFHVYAACATASACLLLTHLARGPKAATLMVAAGIILALPGIGQLMTAHAYLAGDLELLPTIAEVKSPLEMASEPGGFWRVSRYYSLLIWVVPLLIAGCLFELARARHPRDTYFWSACAFGLALLCIQFRFHNFGSIALYLPLIVWAERAASKLPARRRSVAVLSLAILLMLAYVPAISGQMFVPLSPGNDFDYGLTRKLYGTLAETCRRNPGVVLASSNDGHYIRFHTDCSVIANNFVITRQHEEKIRAVANLLALGADELAAAENTPKYVFVHLEELFAKDPHGKASIRPIDEVAASNPRLVRELVLGDSASLPSAYVLLDELRFAGIDGHSYARLLELRR